MAGDGGILLSNDCPCLSRVNVLLDWNSDVLRISCFGGKGDLDSELRRDDLPGGAVLTPPFTAS